MARLIFILAIIIVYFLTIVSKNTLANKYTVYKIEPLNTILDDKDTISTLFQDDFEDGNLLGWEQTEEWEVSSTEKISGAYSLKHLSKATSGFSSIFHPMAADCNAFDLEWAFKLKNGNWDPSSTNRFWFYLSADTIQTNLINGWAVGVNLTGNSDLLELWRMRSGKPDSLIIQTDLDWNNSILVTIDVKRSAQGIWSFTYRKAGETDSTTFSGTDLMVPNFRNIGVCFNYTPTRAGLLWVDDIVVKVSPADVSIQKLIVINSHTISLTFNKPINKTSLQLNNFKLTDENNLTIPILGITQDKVSNQVFEIQLGQVNGVQLSLSVSGVADLSGKTMNPMILSFPFSFLPEAGSVLINEVLFNPPTGGDDFVELVNVSETPVSVHHLKLAARNDTLALKQIYGLSTTIRYLKPGHYLTCTKDPQLVIPFYISNDPETFCILKSFPSYPDDAGSVVLLNDSLEVIDELSYTAKMHSPFLTNVNGVSLERISWTKPTSDHNNWASAAGSAGFATPGSPNSQTETKTQTTENIHVEPIVFSPNGDGFNDQLTIRFSLDKLGYIANIRIFDVVGRQVKFLVKNQSLAQEGSWIWKGESDSNQRLKLGIYIILVELFDSEGYTKTFKKICTLTDRLN